MTFRQLKEAFMRGGYRGIPKPKLPSHSKRVHVNARIQKWMLDELKKQGEVGIVLEYILGKMQDLSINLKNNDFLPDYNGALPQAPGFSALRTQAWLSKEGQRITHCPHALVTNFGARVASQQEPYPPNW